MIGFRDPGFVIILEEERAVIDLKHQDGKFRLHLTGNDFVLYNNTLHHRLISLVCTAAIGNSDDKMAHFCVLFHLAQECFSTWFP